MSLDELFERLDDAKLIGGQLRSACPVHGGRSRALAVKQAAVGRRPVARVDSVEHDGPYSACASSRSDAFSPIISVGAFVLPLGMNGITEASATRSASTP